MTGHPDSLGGRKNGSPAKEQTTPCNPCNVTNWNKMVIVNILKTGEIGSNKSKKLLQKHDHVPSKQLYIYIKAATSKISTVSRSRRERALKTKKPRQRLGFFRVHIFFGAPCW